MTQREALQVLIEHASRNCRGSGMGIRSLPNTKERKRVSEAIEKIWSKAYTWKMADSDKRNLGIGED